MVGLVAAKLGLCKKFILKNEASGGQASLGRASRKDDASWGLVGIRCGSNRWVAQADGGAREAQGGRASEG